MHRRATGTNQRTNLQHGQASGATAQAGSGVRVKQSQNKGFGRFREVMGERPFAVELHNLLQHLWFRLRPYRRSAGQTKVHDTPAMPRNTRALVNEQGKEPHTKEQLSRCKHQVVAWTYPRAHASDATVTSPPRTTSGAKYAVVPSRRPGEPVVELPVVGASYGRSPETTLMVAASAVEVWLEDLASLMVGASEVEVWLEDLASWTLVTGSWGAAGVGADGFVPTFRDITAAGGS